MKNEKFRTYYLLCLLGILLVSFYPMYMGAKVLDDYIKYGYVLYSNYPKYLIPYTPISLSLITCVALLPLALKIPKGGQIGLTVLGISLFVLFELLMEGLLIRQTSFQYAQLGDWQMALCISTPLVSFQETAVSILVGDYSPTFKLHFYAIAVLIILTAVNCFYGFGKQLQNGDRSRTKALILQSAGAGLFLGLCVLACFTAFFRTGEIQVSPLSALLMTLFFLVFGLIAGIFTLSFLIRKSRRLAWIPGLVAALMTLLMYIGEMCLLSGHLYRFGTGWFFSGLEGLVLAPVDILIILASGAIGTAISLPLMGKTETSAQ